jgi:thioesterase domain-containing protein
VLEPVHPQGVKPPFFVVHGVHGTMAIGRAMARALGPDQPLYVLHGRGIDGTEPPHERMEHLLRDYLADIRAVRPRGPYIVGGVCAGGLVAMELARALTASGERVGPVVLVDPPLMPFPHPANRNLDPKADRRVHQQLHANVEQMLRKFAHEYGNLPFEANDPVQLERAISVGIAMLVLFGRYMPLPFDGPTEFVISSSRALSHFHPEGQWKKVVAKPGRVHVVPGNHEEFFDAHLDEVLRLVAFALDSAFRAETAPPLRTQMTERRLR